MNARLALLAALLAGLAGSASAAMPAAGQANNALETSRTWDGASERPSLAVQANMPGGRRRSAAEIARDQQAEEAARGRTGAAPQGQPLEAAAPAPAPLTSWNPLLNGAKGALAIGIVGFVLGGPLGLLVGAAVGGVAAWGLTKIGDA